MNTLQSVRAVLRQYADFSGAASRRPAAVSPQVLAPTPVTTAS
ncbi:MAG: hypothetical protein QOI70_1340 [Microbacteriaceae bacterium]|jgi:hypothetical protein|nr:hypothetical protein [Microbacteriaceae bacterium]